MALITTLSTVLLMLAVLQSPLSAHTHQVCSVPKTVENTKMNLFFDTYKVKSHLRYTCADGYKRQAGTSNLAICQINTKTKEAEWKYGNISCIRDPSIPIPTPSSTTSPFTTSASSSSHVSISSSTTVETVKSISSTITVKIHETLHTIQDKVTQTTQIPAHTPVTWLPTINDSFVPGRTRSPGIQFSPQTILPEETRRTPTEQPEYTGYTATMKQSTATNVVTSVQDINHAATEPSIWQKPETVAMAVGTPVIIIICLFGVILAYCKRRRKQTSPGNPEGLQMYEQTANPQDSDTPAKEEDTFL